MLSEEIEARIKRQIKNFTENYRQSKALGYDVKTMGLPSFETQQDHDLYHPNDAGQDIAEHNEYVGKIATGLIANGVPAELVIVRYAGYSKWLNGRENTGNERASYCGMLVAENDERRKKPTVN